MISVMQILDNHLMARQLTHFAAIAEAGSLNKAAETLGIAQSALTRSVRQLEERIGCQLFQRGPRGSTITPEGEVLLECTQRIKIETNLALMAISHVSEREKPVIRVGVAPAFGLGVLPDAVATFHSKHPGFRIQIRQAAPAGLIKRLVAAELDLYVGPIADQNSASGIVLSQTSDIPSQVYSRRGHPLTRRKTVETADLLQFEWISLIEESGPPIPGNWLGVLTQFAYEHGMKPPDVVVETSSVINALSIASKSDYLVCLSSLLRHEAKVRGVTNLTLTNPLTEHSTAIAYRTPMRRNPIVIDFVDMIKDLLPNALQDP